MLNNFQCGIAVYLILLITSVLQVVFFSNRKFDVYLKPSPFTLHR